MPCALVQRTRGGQVYSTCCPLLLCSRLYLPEDILVRSGGTLTNLKHQVIFFLFCFLLFALLILSTQLSARTTIGLEAPQGQPSATATVGEVCRERLISHGHGLASPQMQPSTADLSLFLLRAKGYRGTSGCCSEGDTCGKISIGEMPMGGRSISDLPSRSAMETSVTSGPCTNVRQSLILMSHQHCLQGTPWPSMSHPGLAWGFHTARAHPLLQGLPQPSDATRMVSFGNIPVSSSHPACGQGTEGFGANPLLKFLTVGWFFLLPSPSKMQVQLSPGQSGASARDPRKSGVC